MRCQIVAARHHLPRDIGVSPLVVEECGRIEPDRDEHAGYQDERQGGGHAEAH